MSKQHLIYTIEKLTKVFSDDQEALKACQYLTNKISDQFEDDDPKTDQVFKIPKELKNYKGFVIYTDGACRGNPGPGSWAYFIQNSSEEIISQAAMAFNKTTNNQMELEAVIQSLDYLKDYINSSNKYSLGTEIHLYSDSKYVVEGFNSWINGWKNRGWKKSDKKEPENLAQWKQLDIHKSHFKNIYLHWVRGHSGHPQNEYCDLMANVALDKME